MTPPMTPQKFLDDLRAKLAAATPGPWESDREIVDSHERLICETGIEENNNPERDQANAALIASAPTLLIKMADALEVAEKALNWVVKPGHDEPDNYTRLGCAQFRAHEALEEIQKILGGGE